MNQNKTKQKKVSWYNIQLEKEKSQLKILQDKYWRSENFHWFNFPQEYEVMLARKDHICSRRICRKTIPKSTFYFRRSFGQLWTIKACSIECFCWSFYDI